MEDDVAIQVVNLTKHYDKLTAVDHISFAVKRGELSGFLTSAPLENNCEIPYTISVDAHIGR